MTDHSATACFPERGLAAKSPFRKTASDSHIPAVYPQLNGDGEVPLLHWKRSATGRFFLFRMTKPGVTLTGEMCLWEDETPIGTGLPMLFDFLDEVRIQNIVVK